jgi:hypothetical protein
MWMWRPARVARTLRRSRPMMKRARTVLTARTTVIALLVAIAAAMAIAAIVPQVGLEAEGALPVAPGAPSRWSAAFAVAGLDHVFSTPWFAALAGLFVVSLSLSTLDQLRLARARTFQPPPQAAAAGERASALPPGELDGVLRRAGYRRVAVAGTASRWVKHAWGYWGAFLLHLGMTMTALFASTYVLTEHRAKLQVASGRPEALLPGTYALKRGLLALDIPLPAEVTLYRVEPTFGASDQLVDLASDLVFRDRRGRARDVRVAVNAFQDYDGIIVYQLVKYGNVFDLEISDEAGGRTERPIKLAYPEKRGEASYGNQAVGGGRVLKAKYHPRSDRAGMVLADPELVLRLVEGDRVLGEATLREGETSQLGPWAVRLARVGWWTEILFEGSLGTTGIFAGFGVLLLGGVLSFFAVPREVLVRAGPEGTRVLWRTLRFPDLYREEGEALLASLAGGLG